MIPFFGCAREYEKLESVYHMLLTESLAGGQFLQGSPVFDFEGDIAEFSERHYGVATGSCTDALFFALLTLDIGPGDEVLVPTFTFIATASAVARTGAKPVFVDIYDNYQMDLRHAEEQITPRTKAMVVVDLFGAMEDVYGIQNFSHNFKLKVVEDAAQALGASLMGASAGSIGDASCFSFDPTKPLCAPGSGGALVTDESLIACGADRLRYHGKIGARYCALGYNSQMSSYTAALLRHKLEWYERPWRRRRQEIADWYDYELRPPVQGPALGPEHAYSKYVIRVQNRDRVRGRLVEKEVPTRVYYDTPLHKQPAFSAYANCPTAEKLSEEVLALPIHAFLTDAEIEQVTEGVKWAVGS